jgi:hypothetical protein
LLQFAAKNTMSVNNTSGIDHVCRIQSQTRQ